MNNTFYHKFWELDPLENKTFSCPFQDSTNEKERFNIKRGLVINKLFDCVAAVVQEAEELKYTTTDSGVRYVTTAGTVMMLELCVGYLVSVKFRRYVCQGTGEIWLDGVVCSGNEWSLFECTHPGWGVDNCIHSADAGVSCSS
ncbi:hypothetical protein KUTeg_017254 [Tegillarca granosa]|uniref:SRCR domain-containing protein n=1 Tax=Tegillarca granosa TaxID=220873 RepID=A0ABQ9EIQ7_TEGGR|nr:hypothetical protein KUTeg_017254 [Tegillarca granosa]